MTPTKRFGRLEYRSVTAHLALSHLVLAFNSKGEVDRSVIPQRDIQQYIEGYLAGVDNSVARLPQDIRQVLPDRFVAHQEVVVYKSRFRFVGIEYRGVHPQTEVRYAKWKEPLDFALLPRTDILPTGPPALSLKPLVKSTPNQRLMPRILLIGDPTGVSLLDLTGNSRLVNFNVPRTQGRYALQDLYIRRHFKSGNTASRFIRYFEALPAKRWAINPETATANAEYDVQDQVNFIKETGVHRPVKQYVRIGEVMVKGREKGVMVLGKDLGEARERLLRIRDELAVLGYEPFLAREEPDVSFASLEEKVKGLLHLARFAVMEDSVAGGQIAEFGYCKDDRHILVLLRQEGKHSTWMISDAHLVDVPYIRVFEYNETNLDSVLRQATKWSEDFLERRITAYQKHFPWRQPPGAIDAR